MAVNIIDSPMGMDIFNRAFNDDKPSIDERPLKEETPRNISLSFNENGLPMIVVAEESPPEDNHPRA